ncbi:DUF3817 domain-containing protein [Chitinophaga nivalis]|uniref:DUF3817 domain-containing protein n=1 Tax=Chitinophaga nivalis TaxID=2991709 RepID=A0ABT3IER4_9BACT|nr:DUF3817 domain-containing protein [Chitinophaga nivalis]MCW3467861.1 DUF3817 domain-containing protein [Chitinophaga nivalis]MCW3482447.1 DUF3817 domain-containing protein [Chitinophaga nivalis]
MITDLFTNATGRLRLVAFLEGLSFLLLLGIAMPLKYMADMPQPVKMIGMAHGVLFILYFILVINKKIDDQWSLGKMFLAILAGVVPFGTFYVDAKWLKPAKS